MNTEEQKIHTIIVEFLRNFQIYRSGNYDIGPRILSDAASEYIKSGTINIIEDYEIILFAYWDSESKYYEAEIEHAEKILEILNDASNSCLKHHDDDAKNAARLYAERSIRAQRHYSSYPARRKRSNAALQNPKLREAVFSSDNYECRECGSTENLSLDHIISVRNGGNDAIENLQTLCITCNSKKGSR